MSLSRQNSRHESLDGQPSETANPSDGILRLNTDAIAEIMKHIEDPQELSNLMKTCYILYVIGVFPLLQLPIHIDTDSSLASFRDFLFADPCGSNRRFEIVRSLDIDLELGYEEASSVIDILARCTNLQDLSISHCDDFFDLCPHAVQVMANLTQLIDVTLESAESNAISWLRQTKSPLSKIDIAMSDLDDDEELYPILSRFSNTLTKLRRSNVRLAESNTQFIHLRTLKICTRHSISAASIAHSFPNLESLDIMVNYLHGHPGDEVIQKHALNKARLSSSGLSLPSLRYLKGAPQYLFSAGIEPRAREFKVDQLGEWNMEWFFELLRLVQPSTLRIPININEFEFVPLVAFFEPLFEEHISIEELRLFIDFEDEKDKDIEEFIEAFPNTIKGKSFKSLCLRMKQSRRKSRSCLRTLDVVKFIAKISVMSPDTQNITVRLRPGGTTSICIDEEYQETGKTFRDLREELQKRTSVLVDITAS